MIYLTFFENSKKWNIRNGLCQQLVENLSFPLFFASKFPGYANVFIKNCAGLHVAHGQDTLRIGVETLQGNTLKRDGCSVSTNGWL
jgi:hypothetical protein